MNIIFLNDQAHVDGGVAQVALEEAKALAKKGLRVFLFSCTPPIDPTLEPAGVKVVCLGQAEILHEKNRLAAFMRGIWNQKACKELKIFLKNFDPKETVVHVHGWMKTLSPVAIHVAIKMGFKVVLTLHGYFIVCPNGGFMDYPAIKICKRTPLGLSCMIRNCDARCYAHKLWRTARHFLQNKILRISDRVHHYIAVSQFCANVVRPYLPQNVKMDVLNNPIDASHLPLVDVESNKKFVYVGRFSPEKGVSMLACAAAKLNAPVIFVGDGYLKNDIQKIYPQAEFTGWLPREKVVEKIREARALVFPSICYEGQPLTPVEAAAQGVPVITSDCNAAIDYIDNGVTGLYFKTNSADDLCEKMQKLMDPSYAARLGRQAYEKYWNDPWSIEKHTQKLLGIYESVFNS